MDAAVARRSAVPVAGEHGQVRSQVRSGQVPNPRSAARASTAAFRSEALAEVVGVDAHRHAGVCVPGQLRRRRRVQLEADDQVRRVRVPQRVRRQALAGGDRDPGLCDGDAERATDVVVPLRLPAAGGEDGVVVGGPDRRELVLDEDAAQERVERQLPSARSRS